MIAKVNGEEISVREFDLEFKDSIIEANRERGKEQIETLKKAYLDQMIERKLLLQEARRIGLKVSKEELDHSISEIQRDYPGEGFGERLLLKSMSLEEWKVRLEERLLAEKMIHRVRSYDGKIDEKEALEYYERYLSLRDSLNFENRLALQKETDRQNGFDELEQRIKLDIAGEEISNLELKTLRAEAARRENELKLLVKQQELDRSERERLAQSLALERERYELAKRGQELLALRQQQIIDSL